MGGFDLRTEWLGVLQESFRGLFCRIDDGLQLLFRSFGEISCV